MSITKLFPKEKINGKKSTAAKPKVEFKLPEVKIQPEDVEPVFYDMGRCLVSLDFDNLKKNNCVDLDDAYKRFNAHQITEDLARYYYETIEPDPEVAQSMTQEEMDQLNQHNTQMLANRKAFLAWEKQIAKWIVQFPAPFFKKKAFLVQIPILVNKLEAIKDKFAGLIGGEPAQFELAVQTACAKNQWSQYTYLQQLNTQHNLQQEIPAPFTVETKSSENSSWIPLKWQIYAKEADEKYDSRFVNLFLKDGVDVLKLSQILVAKYPGTQVPPSPYFGYLIADGIEKTIKLSYTNWNIKGFTDLWV